MPAEWGIQHWPRCTAEAFLSHCAEDRGGLVLPVFQEVYRRGVTPWIDHHHYPVGRDAFEALRDELLRCRHVVYFITPAMLRQGRGWAHTECAFVATIQQRLRYRTNEIAHVELPLLFVPPNDPIYMRSVWRSLIDKSRICPCMPEVRWWQRPGGWTNTGIRSWKPEQVAWAAETITSFVRQEAQWALELADRFRQDSKLRQEFSGDENLLRRLLAQTPRPYLPP
jgi:hypothetical protein